MKIIDAKEVEVGEITPALAEKLFNELLAFQGYGFPKAHAYSYAVYSAVQLWLRKHYFIEFMCVAMNASDRTTEKKGVCLLDQRVKCCYEKGLTVLPALVNKASGRWSIVNEELVAAINNIKGLGQKDTDIIVSNRPYTCLSDFLVKTKFSDSRFDTLLFAGALDEFGDRQTSYNWYYNIYKGKKNKKDTSQVLFDFGDDEEEALEERQFTRQELSDLFYEMNGFSLQDNLLIRFAKLLSENKHVKTINDFKIGKNKNAVIFGKVVDAFSFTAKSGQDWSKVSVNDGCDEIAIMMKKVIFSSMEKTFSKGNLLFVPISRVEDDDKTVWLGNTDKFEIQIIPQ